MELGHTIEFLTELTFNNNREWFVAHKQEYDAARQEFLGFVEKLILGINAFDPSIGLQEAAPCCYRIYRDIRFSPDKSPYKTWMGAYIRQGGRKSPVNLPGYYFHLEPDGGTFLGHSLLATGMYMPSPFTLRCIRDAVLQKGAAFDRSVKEASPFLLDEGDRLSRIPSGYPKDFKYAEYLKCRNYSLSVPMKKEDISAENVLSLFRTTKRFKDFISKAVISRLPQPHAGA